MDRPPAAGQLIASPVHQLDQRLAATAAQAALAELLVLPGVDLELRIAHELATNPALDCEPPPACGRCHAPLDGLHQAYGCARPAPSTGGDPSSESTATISGATDLLALVAGDLPGPDRWIAATILGDLDARGLLGRTPAGAARWLCVDMARVSRVLRALRLAGPVDLAAADLRDALLLQAAASGLAEPVPALISGHLDDIAAGRFDRIGEELGLDRTAVDAAVAQLRTHLRAPQGLDPGGPVSPPAPPDIVVRWDEAGQPVVAVVQVGPVLRVADGYGRLGTSLSLTPVEQALVRRQLCDARDFLSRLQRRTDTLRAIATTTMARQCGYLRSGATGHAPLTRGEIATGVGVHESTVSRAVAGKTVLLPDRRLVAFASFFGAATGPRERMARLVATETSPLTDSELATALLAHGHRISRRTVAKYRAQLAIPAAPHR